MDGERLTLVVALSLVVVLEPDPAGGREGNLARALRRAGGLLEGDLAGRAVLDSDGDGMRGLLVRLGGRPEKTISTLLSSVYLTSLTTWTACW